MTNKEAWDLYTKDLPVPKNFLDIAYYFMWNACLERRVWLYDYGINPLFPNLYVILVGCPAAGKSITIKAQSAILQYHRDKNAPPVQLPGSRTEQPLLFRPGPTSSTYEGLLVELTRCLKIGAFEDPATKVKRNYIQHAMCYQLSELSSLFKENRNNITKFLLEAYDCGNYDYKPKHGPPDMLRNMCMSFIAGTTPDFLLESASQHIFGDGFSSRTLFIFAGESKVRFHQSTLSEAQKEALQKLRAHAYTLSQLYGQISYDEDTYNYLEEWNEKVRVPQLRKASKKMSHYFGRKGVHALKIAMAMHFSEQTSLTLSLDEIKRAIEYLDSLEPGMTAGLGQIGTNPLMPFITSIHAMLRHAPVPRKLILGTFSEDLSMSEIDECIQYMISVHNVKSVLLEGDIWYRLHPK